MSAELNIKDSHIRVNGIDYFRGGAENVVLGSFGEKKTPLFKINYLEHQGTLPSDKLKVREATVLDIDQASQMAISRSLKAEASGTIAGVPVTVGVDQSARIERWKKGELTLLKLVLENESIRETLNANQSLAARLKDFGKDVRIAQQVFVVVNAQLARGLTVSGSSAIKAEADIKGIKIKVDSQVAGSATKTTSLTISPGTVFAYGLVSIDWTGRSTQVTKVTDDQWGLN